MFHPTHITVINKKLNKDKKQKKIRKSSTWVSLYSIFFSSVAFVVQILVTLLPDFPSDIDLSQKLAFAQEKLCISGRSRSSRSI